MATISRLDHGIATTAGRSYGRPSPSGARMLALLGIRPGALEGDTVTVQSKGLEVLLREIARHQPFDPEFYADRYPDLEAARLAGQITDLHHHFVEAGFLEGRLPSDPPFDPVWYSQYYPDLSATIAPHDVTGLRNHFLTTGIAEGRAGTAASLAANREWLAD